MGLRVLQNLETTESIEIPEPILEIYDFIEKKFSEKKDWKRMHEFTLWKQLCLCILSSNVNFDSAKSALSHLAKTGLLESDNILNISSSQKIIALHHYL